MNHYDGPAFYRKFVHDGTINKTKKRNAIQNEKRQYSRRSKGITGFSRDIQRANFGNFKPVKTKAMHIDLQNNPIARITANFKPRKHYGTPDQPATSEANQPNEFEKISDHYQRLTSELSPRDDDVTLLASSSSNQSSGSESQREGTLHFKLAFDRTKPGSESADSKQTGFSRISHNHFVSQSSNDGSETSVPKSSQAPSSFSVETNELSRKESESPKDLSHAGFSTSSDSTDTSVVDDAKDSDSSSSFSSDDINQPVVKITSNLSNSSVESSSDNDRSEPLGHNFSSIMHDEGEDIKKNLTLFNESNSGADSDEGSDVPPESSESDEVTKSSSENSDSEEPSQGDDADEDRLNSSSDVEITPRDHIESQAPQSVEHHPDFVAQNPTNVQPSSDFDDVDSDEDEHHNIQPSNIRNYKFPNHELLVAPKHYKDQGLDDWILNKAEILNKTLRAFHVNAQVVDWTNGPTVTQFQVKLHLGVKVSKINHLADDLKMALAAKDIRIQAPIPGKTTCGIEIPNPKPRPVMLSEVVNSKTFRDSKSDLTIALGVDLTGKPRVTDLRKMPHGLIAGATGSGKSVFINCMLISLMYKATPQELKMILIDPKAVEFAPYNGIPYLLSPVISEPKQAAASLKWATKEMNQRYEKLAAAGVRNIEQFNKKAEQNHQPEMKMPYILIVIDELADLMMVAGDEIETYIVRITQKARAAGIHLVVATQRPSVDVITGTMKNNIPTRVAFMVSSQVDSRTIIDQSGAERLLGKGDMLYLGNGSSHPIRLQGCYVSNQEIDKVAGFAKHQEPAHYAFHPGSLLKHVNRIENQDKLMPQVLAYIAKEKTVSTSKLQRVFSIGYNRAAKIIDDLEQHNYISGQEGSKPRDVYLSENDYKKLNL